MTWTDFFIFIGVYFGVFVAFSFIFKAFPNYLTSFLLLGTNGYIAYRLFKFELYFHLSFAVLTLIFITMSFTLIGEIEKSQNEFGKKVANDGFNDLHWYYASLLAFLGLYVFAVYKYGFYWVDNEISLWKARILFAFFALGNLGFYGSVTNYLKRIELVKRFTKNLPFFVKENFFLSLHKSDKNLENKYKEFETNEWKTIDKILNSKIDEGEFIKISLGREIFYFKSEFFADLSKNLESKYKNIKFVSKDSSYEIFKTSLRYVCDEKFIKKTAENDTQTSENNEIITKNYRLFNKSVIDDFYIYIDEVRLHFMDNDEVYIHDAQRDNFEFCECCNSATPKENITQIGDEWFCSDMCKQTQIKCESIAKENRNLASIDENLQKDLSTLSSVAVSVDSTATAFKENYEIYRGSDDYLRYTTRDETRVGTSHGISAEKINTIEDKIHGHSVEWAGRDNAKNGADRIVDGVKIQSKYYKTATKSVNSAFDSENNGMYRYMDNGKPMQLEVPKDQYEKAVEVMENKIRQGKVPGVSDPNEAKNIVRKGNTTLQEAKDYARFGTATSLKYDAIQGVYVAGVAFGVSFVINTSVAYFKTGDIKEALKNSAISSMKAGGVAFITFVTSSQIQRIPAVAVFLEKNINFAFKSSVGKAFVKTQGGNVNAANTALRGTVVVSAVMVGITSSIEIINMMRGQISGMQCFKNIVVNSAGIAGGVAGAAAGAAMGSVIPVAGTFLGALVGGMLGGMGAGSLAKNAMDKVIVDDAILNQKTFTATMIMLATQFSLNENEIAKFRALIDEFIAKRDNFFGSFSANVRTVYCNAILKPMVVGIVSSRSAIPQVVFSESVTADIIEAEILSEK